VEFSSARGMCEPSGRADAADRCRGGDHRGEDKSTGSGVQAHTTDPARSVGWPPRWRQADSLADVSAHPAVTARGLLKGSTQADDGRVPAALVACEVSSRAGGRR